MRPVIVVGLDRSLAPGLAWDEAVIRARRVGADLIAVAAPDVGRHAPDRLLRAWDVLRQRAHELCGCAGLDLVVARSDLASELARIASEERADLVVVDDDLWTSAELVLRVHDIVSRAGSAVIIVRSCRATGVMVGGITGNATSYVAAVLADELKSRRQSFGFLVHCAAAAAPTADDAHHGGSRAHLESLLVRHHMRGTAVALEAEPVPGVVTAATDLHAELILVGPSRRARLQAPVGDSVAGHVVRHAPCSVMVVPPPMLLRAVPGPRAPRSEA